MAVGRVPEMVEEDEDEEPGDIVSCILYQVYLFDLILLTLSGEVAATMCWLDLMMLLKLTVSNPDLAIISFSIVPDILLSSLILSRREVELSAARVMAVLCLSQVRISSSSLVLPEFIFLISSPDIPSSSITKAWKYLSY